VAAGFKFVLLFDACALDTLIGTWLWKPRLFFNYVGVAVNILR
jgi:hypothetical protein